MSIYSDPSIDKTFHLIVTLLPNYPYYVFDDIALFRDFHMTFATDAASQKRTLTPDTWSCPIWDLHLF